MSTAAQTFDFKQMADQVRDALLADPFFAAIPAPSGSLVVSLDSGDITTEIQDSINKIGLNLSVTTNDANVHRPNQPGPYFDEIDLVLIITENTTPNRAAGNPDGYTATAAACGIIHQLNPDGDELFSITRVRRVLNPPAGQNVWNVFIRTQGGMSYQRTQLAPVTVSSTTAGLVTLSCATPGAPIWFTLDGTYPSPRNPTAQLYLPYSFSYTDQAGNIFTTQGGVPITTNGTTSIQPLTVAAGQTLSARAWLAGYAPATPPQLTQKY